MSSPPPEPSWRKPVGILGMLLYMALYALLVSSFADLLATLPNWLAAIVYLIAGIAWVLPLRPLFVWMNPGRWTHDGDGA